MTQETTQPDTDAPPPTSGERLMRAREARGLSLADVADATKQSREKLIALEAMDVNHMPPTLLRMQAMAYARFLGLPPEEIASGYVADRGETAVEKMPNVQGASNRVDIRRLLVPGAVLAGLGLVIGAAIWMAQPTVEDRSRVSVATLVPVSEQSDQARVVNPAHAENELSLRAIQNAFIEVRGSDGTIFRSRQMSKGEVYYPRMDAGWTITVRDGGAFEWLYAGISAGPVGVAGQPSYSLNVDQARAQVAEKVQRALAAQKEQDDIQ